MLSEKIMIDEHKNLEKLVPVITYVNGHFQHKAINAWLSFLTICHNDICNNVRIPDTLSAEDENTCNGLLNKIFDTYIRVESLTKEVQTGVIKTVFKILKNLDSDASLFLKERYLKICGQYSYQTHWCKYEKASTVEEIINYKNTLKSAIQEKNFIDFSTFFIALTLVYRCSNDFFEFITSLDVELSYKFGSSIPSELFGLCLWTIDFSFVEENQQLTNCNNEYLAILKAIRSINQDLQVHACFDSRLWSRDIIAWVDDNHESYIKSVSNDIYDRIGSGLLNEGGNIITGTARNKFILVAQGPLTDNFTEVYFYQEMDNLCIRTYTLPDGFIWSRNPETKQDLILDSIHIDTVINCIPSWCTVDGRIKVIIDPCYYEMIKENTEFKRFLKEQEITTTDIIIVDKREQYLNLPNFSVIFKQTGEKSLLFNKDHGYTLPRLDLIAGVMVQPEIEIVNIASFFGSIRCATNMLPESMVKNPEILTVSIEDTFSAEIKNKLQDLCQNDKSITSRLSKLWVKQLNIRVSGCEQQWEFDESSRTAFINLRHEQTSDLRKSSVAVYDRIQSLTENLSQNLGILF
jgi:hypothetical protein